MIVSVQFCFSFLNAYSRFHNRSQIDKIGKLPLLSTLRLLSRCFHFGIVEIFVSSLFIAVSSFSTYLCINHLGRISRCFSRRKSWLLGKPASSSLKQSRLCSSSVSIEQKMRSLPEKQPRFPTKFDPEKTLAMLQCCKQFFVFSPYFFCVPFIFRTFAGRKQSDGSSLPVCRHDTQGRGKSGQHRAAHFLM